VSTNVRLTEPLGEGAMGCVWAADHLTLHTRVAVKFISAELGWSDPEILTRFMAEAATAAQIKSPHVVQTFDQGMMNDGTPYIVMELLEGETLQERIDRAGRLSLVHAAQVVTQMARVLTKAHALGIVHRDIKPDNIFVSSTEDGIFCKVLDFGIAKQTQLPKMGGLTNPGVMVGTPEYMSPEQVLSAKDVDARADQWALAVTIYHAITSRLPFTAEALGTLCVKLLDGSFKPASELRRDLNAGFDAWFLKALAHDPDHRFDSTRTMAHAFVELVAAIEGNLVDDISFSDVATVPGLDVTPAPAQTAAPASYQAGPAVAQTVAAAPSGTLTGSASNRQQPAAAKSRWRIAGPIAVAIGAVAVGAAAALIGGASQRPEAEPAAREMPAASGARDATPQPSAAPTPPAQPSSEASGAPTSRAAARPPAVATSPSSSASDTPTASAAPSPNKPPSARKPAPPPTAGSGKVRRRDHGF